ncbi:DeoR/GlpR family DNA-binding transcription regulator [Arhodomonas sp. AD133]|uniref:DeoR/GlpR family DNA-binding transcription regulator n=1 Tax=Arhodomonas sp. AD133 TaxID=3415009 RepID=UPI003EB765DC
MSTTVRRNELLDYILRHGSVGIEDLVRDFGVSRMTVHRDLDALEHEGVIRRVRGGASALPSALYESDYRYRLRTATKEKASLARAALAHVEPGQCVMLDDSTTVLALAELLPAHKPLTVISNSFGILERLCDAADISLIGLGGTYSRHYNAFFGLVCENAVAALRADVLFMSVSAVNGTIVFHQDEQIVKAKRAMMAAASRRVLLVDHRKFGTTALNRLGELSEFDAVLTTQDFDADLAAGLEEDGVNIRVVTR